MPGEEDTAKVVSFFKILGDSTGLDSFWVLFAVLVGGGLFGFIGMVIGIPIFVWARREALERTASRESIFTPAERWCAWVLVFVALVAILVFIGHSAKLERHEHRWAHEVETEIRHWADE